MGEEGMAKQSKMVITLPWPPSINNYWRRGPMQGMYISKAGINYRKTVLSICNHLKNHFADDRLAMTIEAFPPDRRKRDLDNILKSLLDSLQNAKVFCDDGQIDYLCVERKTPRLGQVIVSIANYQGTSSSSTKESDVA